MWARRRRDSIRIMFPGIVGPWYRNSVLMQRQSRRELHPRGRSVSGREIIGDGQSRGLAAAADRDGTYGGPTLATIRLHDLTQVERKRRQSREALQPWRPLRLRYQRFAIQ